jgi:hypothetical protein
MKTREEMVYDLTVDELDWFVGYVEDCGSDYEGRRLAIKEMAGFIIRGGFNKYEDEELHAQWDVKFTDDYPTKETA